MAVSEEDVRHVAELARLGIDPARLPSLVRELNGILGHMDVLNAVEVGAGRQEPGPSEPAPLRQDDLAPLPLSVPREDFAPEMRDGFFLVPRLSTHEDAGERSP